MIKHSRNGSQELLDGNVGDNVVTLVDNKAVGFLFWGHRVSCQSRGLKSETIREEGCDVKLGARASSVLSYLVLWEDPRDSPMVSTRSRKFQSMLLWSLEAFPDCEIGKSETFDIQAWQLNVKLSGESEHPDPPNEKSSNYGDNIYI